MGAKMGKAVFDPATNEIRLVARIRIKKYLDGKTRKRYEQPYIPLPSRLKPMFQEGEEVEVIIRKKKSSA